jgi:hypothetical protein
MAGTFPSLSINPAYVWDEEAAADPTLRSRSEGGYQKTRPRHTRIPMKWTIVYDALPASDKDTLQGHEHERGVGSASFTWTNPIDSQQYTVRFAARIKYKLLPYFINSGRAWRVEFDLEEV